MMGPTSVTQTLAGAVPRVTYCIRALDADEEARRRLIGMGLVPGVRVEVLRRLGCGPLAVRVGDTRLALDLGLAERILVAPVAAMAGKCCRASGRHHRWGWRRRSKAV